VTGKIPLEHPQRQMPTSGVLLAVQGQEGIGHDHGASIVEGLLQMRVAQCLIDRLITVDADLRHLAYRASTAARWNRG